MFKKMAPDKWRHFILAIPMGAVIQAAGIYFLPEMPFVITAASFIAVIVICYGFELFSLLTGKGHYEMMDAIVGIIGGAIGIGLVWLFI